MKNQKDVMQLVRRLVRDGIVVEQRMGGKHPQLILHNGRCYVMSRTPSDHRGVRNMEAAIKRLA